MTHGKIKRVYIAGPPSDPPNHYAHNCGIILSAWSELVEHGFACYCPAADVLLGIYHGHTLTDPIELDRYRSMSLVFLAVCDVVYVIGTHHKSDRRQSAGVRAEILAAEELGIPVVYAIDDLLRLRGTEP